MQTLSSLALRSKKSCHLTTPPRKNTLLRAKVPPPPIKHSKTPKTTLPAPIFLDFTLKSRLNNDNNNNNFRKIVYV